MTDYFKKILWIPRDLMKDLLKHLGYSKTKKGKPVTPWIVNAMRIQLTKEKRQKAKYGN